MLSINIFSIKFLNEVHPSIFSPVKNCAIRYIMMDHVIQCTLIILLLLILVVVSLPFLIQTVHANIIKFCSTVLITNTVMKAKEHELVEFCQQS